MTRARTEAPPEYRGRPLALREQIRGVVRASEDEVVAECPIEKRRATWRRRPGSTWFECEAEEEMSP